MNKILRSLAVLVLALAGLMGCDSEPRTVEDVSPAHVAEAKEAFRDLWIGHILLTRYVVLNNATHNPERGMPPKRKSWPMRDRSQAR